MKKNKSDFDFTLSNIKKNFDVQDFVYSIWEYIDGSLIYPILDSSIFIQESNNTFDGQSNMDIDQINELQENIYSNLLIDPKNKNIKNQIYEDMFDGSFLPNISDNFKLELFFQYKNESHYLIYSKFNNLRIYIACVKDLKKNKIEAYVVNFSEDKISKIDFLKKYIYDNSVKEENYLFDLPENYFSKETSLLQTDCYLYFVKSYLPKIDFSNKTKEDILEIISEDVSALKDLPTNLRKDKNFILKAIKLSEFTALPLYYLDDDLKKDKEIVFETIKKESVAFKFADGSLKKDKKFVLKVVEHNGYALEFVAPSLQKDEDVVLLAIEDCGTLEYSTAPVIQYADKSLQKNKEFILKAIEKSTDVFEHISNNFKKDPEILKQVENTRWWDQYVRTQAFKENL